MPPSEFLQLLNSLLRPELNMLYSVPPFDRGTPGSFDAGWFCREHAYHSAIVANMCGCESAIFTGHFVVNFQRVGGTMEITSLDTSAGHAWCSVGSMKPVDLSMHLQYWPGDHPVLSGVFGTDPQAGFEVLYSTNETDTRAARVAKANDNWIGFLEEQKVGIPVDDLVTDPFLFLQQAGNQGWDKLHGLDVFQKVNLHLYDIACKETKPLWQNWQESDRLVAQNFAISQIKQRYPGATKKVRRALAKGPHRPTG
jgi:hypothetical protein